MTRQRLKFDKKALSPAIINIWNNLFKPKVIIMPFFVIYMICNKLRTSQRVATYF